MLKVLSISLVEREKQPEDVEDGNIYIELTLTKEKSRLAAALIGNNNNYTMYTYLERLTPEILTDGEKDVQAMLAKAKDKYIDFDKDECVLPNAYGFVLDVSEVLGDPDIEGLYYNMRFMMTKCSVVGMGLTEDTAKVDAIRRERTRLNRLLAKGKFEIVYK